MADRIKDVQGQLVYIVDYCELIKREITRLEQENAELCQVIESMRPPRQPIGELSKYCKKSEKCPAHVSITKNYDRLEQGLNTMIEYCDCKAFHNIPCIVVGCALTRFAKSCSERNVIVLPTCLRHVNG